MKILVKIIFLMLIAISGINAQEISQTVRGTIIDQDSKMPLIGVNVLVTGLNEKLGSTTDYNGVFRINNVPLGRINLEISYLGYESRTIPSILVGSSKEVIIEVGLKESVVSLNEITVTSKKHKAESLNKMATVSAKAFSVEETKRYAGAFNDPARMVSSFAGVTGDAQGNNDIVVRGNSPRGILWRLEGIEICNPNHFAGEGTTGGPINALNGAMLANSDFFSGAFAPEYGNALSGVFDMRLRKGNNEKREYSTSLGVLGMEATLEGPFSPGYKGSYLINYRYSSLAILEDIGVVNFGGVPKYQDVSFKMDLPTKSLGNFSVFGLGGLSHIYQEGQDEEEVVSSRGYAGSDQAVFGINNSYIINEKTYIKSSVAQIYTRNESKYELLKNINNFEVLERTVFIKGKTSFASTLNKKFNAKNHLQIGGIYSMLSYNMTYETRLHNPNELEKMMDKDGESGMAQGFVSWKYRFSKDITLVSGVHYTQLFLNNKKSLEPRAGIKWQFSPIQSLSMGVGVHSKLEPVSTYLADVKMDDGTTTMANKNLGFTKAAHFVIGYDRNISDNMHFKGEIYYQHLYDVPVENDVESGYSIINQMGWFPEAEMVNQGTGKNYGVELTLERFYANNYFFMITGSLYDSYYTAMDNVERRSCFAANYAGNILAGKEFMFGKSEKGRSISLSCKVSLIGGNRYTPIDLEKSIEAGYTIRDNDKLLSIKGEDIFVANLAISYRRETTNTTRELKIDIQNVTNNQALVTQYYDGGLKKVVDGRQLALLPNIVYTVSF